MSTTEGLVETTTTPAPVVQSAKWWPTHKPAKLYMPLQWQSTATPTTTTTSGRVSAHPTCTIEFDESRQLLKVIDAERSVIHVINPMDVIGVNVEIQLFRDDSNDNDNPAGPQISCADQPPPTSFGNSPISEGEGQGCNGTNNIWDAVSQNNQGIFACNNDDFIHIDSHGAALLNIYSYPKSNQSKSWWSQSWCTSTPTNKPNPHYTPGTGPRHACHYSFPVAPAHDFEALTQLVKAIRRVSLLSERPGKYFVLINPQSGKGQAQSIWNKVAQIMLEKEAGIDVVIQHTKYPGHAVEIMKEEKDLLSYDAVICLGGDGVLHEVLQGCQARPDFETVLQTIRLGILGCGTGNGLAKSITFASGEHHSILESTFLIARGQTIWMDLSKYETPTNTYTSFLTFTWAMIADLDIESEVVRFLGSFRLDLWAAVCVVRNRRYRGRLSYLPPSTDETQTQTLTMPALTDPVPSNWTVLEDDIILLWASQVSHASEGNYTSPPSHIEDGVFQIMLIRGNNVGRLALATILLSLDSGGHAIHPNVEFVTCVAYRLEPLTKGSYNDLDGEIIESGPVQGQVMPKALQVFCNIPAANQ